MTATEIKHIDEEKLKTDLGYRFGYVSEFMGFGKSDIDAIHASASHLAPLVDSLVDAVYVKLFTYDSTKRHFVPKQHGYDGSVPASLEALTLDHDQIQFRKSHLKNYLVKLVTAPYDDKMVAYLDFVGKIHTPEAGSKEINVPMIQMNALMGFVSTALLDTIMGLDLPADQKRAAISAFNKLLWLQNDLFVRWYAE